MRLVWNELSPKDRYVVRLIRPISLAELGYVSHLYLPIIGMESYALYQLLVHEVQETSGAAAESTHRGLMLITSMSLDRLLTARERLEALGLLEVFRRENPQGDYFYEYRLKPPLSPAEFFGDYVLSLMLLNRVENFRFQQLRRRYADNLWAHLEEEYVAAENLTKGFHEVFPTLQASELEVAPGSEREHFLARMEEELPPAPLQSGYQAEPSHQLNWTTLRLNLPDNTRPELVLGGDTLEFLYRLLHFYQMDSWSLGRELGDWKMYKPDGTLDRDVLRKRLVQKYLNDQLNRMTDTAVTADDALGPGKLPETGSEVYRQLCRRLSPLTLLERVVGGRISKAYLERAENLVMGDGLPTEVVNVMLLHTLQSKQMELPKAYLETIRDTWKAKQITTVDEAVRLLLERADARQQAVEKAARPASKGSQGTTRRGGKAIPADKLPESVQRQLEQEKAKENAKDTAKPGAGAAGKPAERQTVMDDPELKALLESLRKRQKESRS